MCKEKWLLIYRMSICLKMLEQCKTKSSFLKFDHQAVFLRTTIIWGSIGPPIWYFMPYLFWLPSKNIYWCGRISKMMILHGTNIYNDQLVYSTNWSFWLTYFVCHYPHSEQLWLLKLRYMNDFKANFLKIIFS